MIPILILLFGLYVGYQFPIWLTDFLNFISKRQALKKFLPKPTDELRLCKEPHTWTDANSINERGEFGKVHICSVCGFLPSKDMMVTQEALETIIQIKKATELNENIVNDFANMEETTLKEYFGKEIESGLDFQKIIQAYNAGQSMQERFMMYRMAKMEEANKPKEPVIHE